MPDYYTILAQKISEAEDDPAKLRELVYAAARLALKRHVNLYPAASLQQGKQLLRDLETAISRLEEDAEQTSARAEQDPVQDDTQAFFETRASTTDATPPAPEFDFRAAFEGRNSDASEEDGDDNDGSAEHSADDVPAAASKPQPEKEISFTHRSTRQERSTDAPRREERRAHANRRGAEPDQASSRRPDRRFGGARNDEPRQVEGIRDAARRKVDRSEVDEEDDAQPVDEPRRVEGVHDAAWRRIDRSEVDEEDAQPAMMEHRHRMRSRSVDEFDDDEPRPRELVLLPTQGGGANRGSVYVMRPQRPAARANDYYRDPPQPAPLLGRTMLIGMAVAFQVAVVILAAAAFYVAVTGRNGSNSAGQQNVAQTRNEPRAPATASNIAAGAAPPLAAVPTAATAAPAPVSGQSFPRPTAYGVYAIADDHLIDLDQVQTTPADPRTRYLLQIVKPSRTVINEPKLSFVAYRRDFVTTVPEKVPVKIAARLAKAMTFDANGKAVVAPPASDTWIVRDQGYDLRVQPLRDSPEMVLLRPESEDFVFPSGRYVLQLGGQSYDFVVGGPVTDPGQCVEGVATARGPAFYECRTQ